MSGREVVSDDVKWSMEYLSRTGSFAEDKKLAASIIDYTYAGLQSIQTPDKYTAVVRFSHPFAPFLNYSAREWNAILAHEVYEQDGNFSTTLGGTGPFQLDLSASRKGQRWVFRKNQTYQATSIGADQLKKIVPDATTTQFLNSAKNLSVEADKPPFNHVRIRQALSLCVDRDEFLKLFSSGQAKCALATCMPSVFTVAETKRIPKLDPEQAKHLVAQTSYPNGVDAEIVYPGTAYDQQHINEIQLLQSQAKRGNFNITLKSVDKTTESLRQAVSWHRRRGQVSVF